MKELTTDLDLDQEVAALASFVSLKWTPITGISELITEIRTAALWAGRAWFDKHLVWEAATRLEDARKELLSNVDSSGDAPYYDAYCTLLSQLSRATDSARESAMVLDGPWDFERRTKQLTTAVLPKYPDLYTARPLGWDSLAEGYCDFDGMEDYDPRPDRELFEGAKVEGTVSAAFPGRVSLPHVMYSEKCQGLKAYHVLVGALFAHFLGIAEFFNTRRLIEAMESSIAGAVAVPAMLFERQVKTDNPVLLFMLESVRPAPSEADFAEALAARAKFEALSLPERDAVIAENEQSVSRMLSEMLAKSRQTASCEERISVRGEGAKRLNQLFSIALGKV